MIDEKSRLEAVARFAELNKDIAADLNEIVDLAAQICSTPVALVTLVDQDVQWFKASKGVDIASTHRDLAFCNHTIQQNDLLIIPNTLSDSRTGKNPLVADAPHVRFYAGATLTTLDGHNIGSLCVIDMEERQLNDMQLNALKILSKQAMRLIEADWTTRMLEERNLETERQRKLIEQSELKLQAIFNSSKDIHVLVDRNMEILAHNKAASEFATEEYGKNIQAGSSIFEFIPFDIADRLKRKFDKVFAGQTLRLEWNVRPGTRRERWKEVDFVPIYAANGEVVGAAVNSADITERKLQEDQINIQNAALTRVAIIQSHELRRPVASLLGIMALIKLEKKKRDDVYLEMLEYTVKELDEKIREIVKDSEDTINNYLSIVA